MFHIPQLNIFSIKSLKHKNQKEEMLTSLDLDIIFHTFDLIDKIIFGSPNNNIF